jgi:4'-phosphopantetheinyl transferase EntD
MIDVSGRVLTDEELARAGALGEGRTRHVLRAFSMKEAIYKAIDPFLRRYVAFREVALDDAPLDAPRAATFTPRSGEPALVIEVVCSELASPEGELIVSTARARPA